MKVAKLALLILSLIGRMSLMAAVFCESNVLPVDTRDAVRGCELGSEMLLNVAAGNGRVTVNGKKFASCTGGDILSACV